MTVRVLVTGAGGPAGVCAIRGLAPRFGVVAVDADPGAVGLRLAGASRVVPRADRDGFIEALCATALETGASVLLPTVAEELVVLAHRRDELEAAGLAAWLPDPAAVGRCTDKWQFFETLRDASVPTPATGLGGAEGVPGPWILKPRAGRGSRDVYPVDDPAELAVLLARVTDPIVQHRLEGREFTADALVDDETVLTVCPRWRLETKAGISTKGLTFRDAAVESVVAAALRAVGLVGPANVQGFVAPNGAVTVMEINPRLSGGLALTQHAGADLLGACVERALGRAPDPERLVARPGVLMVRHFEEVFETCG